METPMVLMPLIIALVIGLVIGILLGVLMDDPTFGAFMCVALMVVFGLVSQAILAKPVPTGKTIYKVTIGSSVNAAEFNGRYKILSQEGSIYEIVEKDK
jgi:uncharacterized membrane protein YeaQ/YmgE (transglycosylase-associated protein family)